MGFYQSSKLISKARFDSSIPQCGTCGLYKSCISPKMPVRGDGQSSILVVGEAPGENEDASNDQFVGTTGQLLRDRLSRLDIDLDVDCWKTNALICRPIKKMTTTEKEKKIGYCRPNVINAIKELKPRVVILLGLSAVTSVIGSIWKDSIGNMERWIGWKIPCQRYDCWLCPTYHPSFVSRDKTDVADVIFRRHLQEFVSLVDSDRPWLDGSPDYEKRVDVVFETDQAAKILDKMVDRGGEITFDLETTALKPDGTTERIVSNAVCWEGKKTIAYPWSGKAIESTRRLLMSDRIRKIGYNIKFEERWILKEFGEPVTNWIWDGMQIAHVMNNVKAITSLDFQSFVLLGNEKYSQRVSKFFGDGGAANKELSMSDLLLYNGMDALIEYETAKKQMEILGYDRL